MSKRKYLYSFPCLFFVNTCKTII